ncbi:sensor histidine kinase [Lacihabitans lacunae]|uniref:histidine kinase n=1 Tax=Lacihabitans lacunae TaxID=1028214 RepID=A0ABV7Z0S3_9BACT
MKNFGVSILLRISLILLLALGTTYFFTQKYYAFSFSIFIVFLISGYTLFHYVTSLNRKMKRLFESIQYQDFAITFKADNKMGKSFKDLNSDLNAVISSFNQVRSEREATLHFINAIIQQINVGIVSYNTLGEVEISNQTANKLLRVYRLKNINDLKAEQPHIFEVLESLKPGESRLLTLEDNDLSFSITEIQMRGRRIRLLAIHNIRSELQIKELEAWQNLTKVLRHEIMNSVTPIVSLAETMRDIVNDEIKPTTATEIESVNDLKEALVTVQKRGLGIMKFVNAYREFTSIPLPSKTHIEVTDLLKRVEGIFAPKVAEGNIKLSFDYDADFEIFIDQDQLEQVLINIIKNAFEANYTCDSPEISVRSKLKNGIKTIEILDNGTGVPLDIREKIFIPFFTSKKLGSGIGLSLSRQIMALNDAKINYQSISPQGTAFILEFI